MPFDSEHDPKVTARDRLMRLRDFLAKLPAERFDMDTFGNASCGTPACICGWAARTWKLRQTGGGIWSDDETNEDLYYADIGARLGITIDQSASLFAAREGVTPADAARVLDHLLETGEVDWSVA